MKPATDLIHSEDRDVGAAAPLTTPIYETTTFIFESAKEVVAYHEGRRPDTSTRDTRIRPS